MKRLARGVGRLARRGTDDVAALVFPETCRHCGAGDFDVSSAPRTVPRSRLQNGRLRRYLIGPLSLPLRLLCEACCSQIVPLQASRAAAASYDVSAFEPSAPLFTLVHALKYDGIVELVPWLGAYLARVARRRLPRGPLVLVPVPLHAERLAERGFNQSALLAHEVGRRLGTPVCETLLERPVATAPLAQLPHAERRAQVQSAFEAGGARHGRGVRVALIDDVVTTGATRDAARAALDANRAADCVFLALCRAREASSWLAARRRSPAAAAGVARL